MSRFNTLIVIVLLGSQLGCGDAPVAPPSLEEQMAGYWFGNLQISRENADPWHYYSALYVSASPDSITLDGVCPDGNSRVTLTRSGTSASWLGTLHCAWKTTPCPDGTIAYTSATITFGPEAIDLELVGRASACAPEAAVRTLGTLHR